MSERLLRLRVPGLLGPLPGPLPPDALAPQPALELWLARGRRRAVPPEAPPEAAGALAWLADGGDPGDAYWARALPVHLAAEAGGLRLRLPAVDELEAARLETDLADLLAGHGVRLHRAASGRWYLESPHPLPQRPSPYRLAGRCIDPAALRGPEGGAPAWSAVLNELEMALYDHPINRDRQERGALPVNALWPWGAGTCPPAPGAFPWERVYSDEPAWCGLAALAGASHGELVGAMPAVEPQGRTLLSVSWAETALATADGTAWLDAVAAVERTLAAPALAALRGESDAVGQWDALELQTEAGAEHAVALTRGGLRRLWRRPRPLARWLAAGGEGG